MNKRGVPSILLQDMMDPSRRIEVPQNDDGRGTSVVCRVFFKDTGYAGKAPIPRNLLNGRSVSRNDHGGIGFEPVRAPVQEDPFASVRRSQHTLMHGTDEEMLAEMNRMDLEALERPRGRR